MTKRTSTFKGFLFLLISAILFAVYGFYHRKEAIVCRVIQRELEKAYPDLEVKIDSAQLVESKGIRLQNFRLVIPHVPENQRELLNVQEIFVQVPITFSALYHSEVTPKRIVLTRPNLFICGFSASSLAKRLEKIVPQKTENDIICPVEIRDGNLTLNMAARDGGGERFYQSYSGFNGVVTPPDNGKEEKLWKWEAVCENSLIKELHLNGSFLPRSYLWNVTGKANSLDIDPALISRFIPQNAPSWLSTFQGRTSFSFVLGQKGPQKSDFYYQASGEVFRGSLLFPFLENPVSDLFIRYQIQNGQFQIDRLTARSGSALILANAKQNGWGEDKKGNFNLQLEEFPLNETVFAKFKVFLPFEENPLSDETKFSTVAKIFLAADFAKNRWNLRDFSLQCQNLSLNSPKLPWPIDKLAGQAVIDASGRLNFNFASDGGIHPIKISGGYNDILSENPQGKSTLEIADIQIDEAFLKTLPAICQKEIRALRPSGLIDVLAVHQLDGKRKSVSAAKTTSEIPHGLSFLLKVRDGGICYDLFPYPVSQIEGTIRYENQLWTFADFQGKGGTAEVNASGTIFPSPRGEGDELNLNLNLIRFPLGEEFLNALTEPAQKETIRKLHLQGKADADVRIRYLTENQEFHLDFDAYPMTELTSCQPEFFPYPLNNLEGTFNYRDGHLTIPNLRGKNGPMTFNASVDYRTSEQNGWSVSLAPLTIQQLSIDRPFQNALPSQFFTFLNEINWGGYLNLSGALEVSQNTPQSPILTDWDVELILHQNSAGLGKKIVGICGKTRIKGSAEDSALVSCGGELDIDSLCIDNIQVTHLTGPFTYKNRQLLLGKAILPSQLASEGNEKRDVSAPIIRGQASNNSWPKLANRTPNRIPNRIDGVSLSSSGQILSAHSSSRSALSKGNETKGFIPSHSSITGNVFNGNLILDGAVSFNKPALYQLNLQLKGGELDDVLRDLAQESADLNGNIDAFVRLQGEGKNLGTLKGNGGIILTEAKLYELPLMIQILRSLSVQEPDQNAFDSSSIDFQVIGNRLRLDRVLLEGDSLTLFGNGWLTLEGADSQIDLTMNSRLGNRDNQIPVVSDVIAEAGDQIAQIKIEGPLSEASIRREGFPGIKKAWWKIFPDRVRKK